MMKVDSVSSEDEQNQRGVREAELRARKAQAVISKSMGRLNKGGMAALFDSMLMSHTNRLTPKDRAAADTWLFKLLVTIMSSAMNAQPCRKTNITVNI